MPIDMSAAVKSPPKRSARIASSTRNTPSAQAKPITEARADGLTGLGQIVQAALLVSGNYADAATVGMYAEPLAKEVASLAESNEYIARGTDILIQTGPYAGLATIIIKMGMQIAANHKWIGSAGMLGGNVVPPEVLESQMKAQLMRAEAQARREQIEAIAEARKAEAELQKVLQDTGNGND